MIKILQERKISGYVRHHGDVRIRSSMVNIVLTDNSRIFCMFSMTGEPEIHLTGI
ncbi:MAG: hypothetical protein AAGA75_03865 [Cyanobacteria bacterium P01_E01_bin.6]